MVSTTKKKPVNKIRKRIIRLQKNICKYIRGGTERMPVFSVFKR